MIDQDHSGTQGQEPQQGKLVLPAYPDEGQQGYGQHSRTQDVPQSLLYQRLGSAPQNPVIRLGYLWGKDPAHKVLIIATVMVLIAGVIFAAFMGTALMQGSNLLAQNTDQIPQTPPPGVAPTGTVDLHPAFPTPGGGKGSTTSSQPPARATPAFQSGGDNGNGNSTIQITGIPGQVPNNVVIPVTVSTGQPGINVRLQVTYNVAPYFYFSGVQVTDDGGNATLDWHVRVLSGGFGPRHIVAKVTAVAVDQNGQQMTSDPSTVRIITAGMG